MSFKSLAIAVLAVAALAAPSLAIGSTCKFAENVGTKTEKCSAAIAQLPYVSPALKQCYRTTGIYFATPETVCSPNCLDASVRASKLLADACPSNNPDPSRSTPADVYKVWANGDAAKAVCGKSQAGKLCINEFAPMQVMADMLDMSKASGSKVKLNKTQQELKKTFLCADPCTRSVYDSLNGDGTKAPILYFYGYDGLTKLFKAFEEVCQFQPKQSAGTSPAAPAAPAPAY